MSEPVQDVPEFLTPTEAARLLMVAPVTVRLWAQKGLLNAYTTPGGHRRFLRADLEAFRAARAGVEPEAAVTDAAVRILVVDDDEPLARYLVALLEGPGVQVEVAHDGFAAGSKIHQFQPQAVLLDLRMPGVDGFEVCSLIKNDPATRSIRIVAMTGYHDPDIEARIVAAGAECCLRKPLDTERLHVALGLTRTRPVAG